MNFKIFVMKKTILFLVAIMALGAVSCDRLSKKNGTDLVILNGGKMSFYNAKTKALTLFEAETDSVINMVFDKKKPFVLHHFKKRQSDIEDG